MTTLGVIADNRKTLGDGLEALRTALADAGHVDPPWRGSRGQGRAQAGAQAAGRRRRSGRRLGR